MVSGVVTHVVVDGLPSQRPSFLDFVPVLAAVIAAVSAWLSWRAVRQARQIWERSLLPVLKPMLHHDSTKLWLVVTNTSKTLAVDAGWAAIWGDRWTEGWLGDRHVPPEEKISAEVMLIERDDDPTKEPRATAITWCRAPDGRMHVWSTDREHWQIDPKKVTGKESLDLLMKVLSLDQKSRPTRMVSHENGQLGPL